MFGKTGAKTTIGHKAQASWPLFQVSWSWGCRLFFPRSKEIQVEFLPWRAEYESKFSLSFCFCTFSLSLSLSLTHTHTHTHKHTHTHLANPRVKSTTDRSQTPCHTQHCLTHPGGAQDPGEGSLPGHIFLRSQIDPFKGKICFQILESLVTFLLHCLKRISFRLTSVRNASRLKCLPWVGLPWNLRDSPSSESLPVELGATSAWETALTPNLKEEEPARAPRAHPRGDRKVSSLGVQDGKRLGWAPLQSLICVGGRGWRKAWSRLVA